MIKDGFSERSDLDENGEECTCGHCPMCEYEMMKAKESKMSKKTMVWVCAACGSEDVQHAMWVDMNTNEVHDIFGSWCHGDNSFCNNCGENSELVEREKLVVKPVKPSKKAPKKAKR